MRRLCYKPGAMDRITRHVTFEVLRAFAIALTAMTCLMVLIFLVQEGLKEKLTPTAVLQLVPYTLPTALCFAIPGTILFAVCVCYGRMSSQNEITAIRAMGIAPVRMLVPALVIAVLLSIATVWLNDIAATWGRRGIYRVILQTSAQSIYAMLGAEGSFSKGKIYIDVDQVAGENLIHPFIVRRGDSDADSMEIRAQLARILVDTEHEQLVIRLKNAHIRAGDKADVWFDQKDIPVPLGDVTKKKDAGDSPSVLPLLRMPAELARQKEQTQRTRAQLATQLAGDVLGGNMIGLTHPVWGTRFHELRQQQYRESKLKCEPWRRWANGFSCLAFVIVGAPLSVFLQRFDFWTNFALCFIPILLVYYPLLMLGVGEAKSGSLPPFSVWLGNVVMFGAGGYLLRRLQRC